ncbi:hypothetical protein ABZ780_29415 [Micromonospora sp. NPDC047467]|uniref:hypothetical protein n=1 Tax=Micromonospora sp. NPDC047467 TaxID=3154814 RepID=UPI0033FD5634
MSQAIDIRTSPVGEGPLWQAILAQAQHLPSAAALVDGAGDLTYAELVSSVEERAAELTVAGVSAGDLVGLRMPRGRDAAGLPLRWPGWAEVADAGGLPTAGV